MNQPDEIEFMQSKSRRAIAFARRGNISLAGLCGAFALAFVLGVMGLSDAARADTTTGDSLTMVKSTVDQVLNTLQDHSLSQTERQRRVIQLVAGHFDFTDMARSSLGYNWKRLTPEQQDQFVPLFTSFMEAAYLGKISSYTGQRIQFLGQTMTGDGMAEVKSVIQASDSSEEPIQVNYLLKQVGGQWRVFDVTVDDVSITANYRNQFNRVINNQGFDALISAMREKQQQLRNSLGA